MSQQSNDDTTQIFGVYQNKNSVTFENHLVRLTKVTPSAQNQSGLTRSDATVCGVKCSEHFSYQWNDVGRIGFRRIELKLGRKLCGNCMKVFGANP